MPIGAPVAPGRYGVGLLEVKVETIAVEQLLAHAEASVSPEAMYKFLATDVDQFLQNRIIDRFGTEGGEGLGNQWPPLAPATQRIREEMGYGADGPINQRTGQLLEGVTYTEDINIIPGGAEITKPGSEVMGGSMFVRKLQHAQMGADDNPRFPGSVTPPRPVLGLATRDTAAIMALLQKHVMEYMTASIVAANYSAAAF